MTNVHNIKWHAYHTYLLEQNNQIQKLLIKFVHNAKQTFIINLNQKNACIDMFIII